jgi:hypothetical protein
VDGLLSLENISFVEKKLFSGTHTSGSDVRVVTAGSAFLQKCHSYEILSEIERLSDHLAEKTSLVSNHSEPDYDTDLDLREQAQIMKMRQNLLWTWIFWNPQI